MIEVDLNKMLQLLLPDVHLDAPKLDHSFHGDPIFDFLEEYLE